ncbi:MAG: DUF4364 family protein [Oscillospiraceae bacterium]|jgi:hypothetical protein|nr:DUF4364 family protein [Oscillospiraceae bacterium]
MDSGLWLVSAPLEIRIFILFMLRRLDSPMELGALYSLATRNGAVSYFDFVGGLNGLVKTGHAALKDSKYSITKRGADNLATTEKHLPYSLRVKAERSAREYRSEAARSTQVRAAREIRRTGGYTVNMSLSDGEGEGELLSMQMFAAGESDAVALENGFIERAEIVYNAVVNSILGGGEP